MNRLQVRVSDAQGHTAASSGKMNAQIRISSSLPFRQHLQPIKGKGYLQGAGMEHQSEFQMEGRIAYYLKGVIPASTW